MSAVESYSSLQSLKAASAAGAACLVGASGVPDGIFFFTSGDFTNEDDNKNIVKADSTPLTVGAWVRQGADKVTFRGDPVALLRDSESKARETKSVQDAGADPDSRYVAEDDPLLPPIGSDGTAAFRIATRSADTYQRIPEIEKTTHVTTGRYRLDGETDPVFVRKGATLMGVGYGSHLDGSANGDTVRVVLGAGDGGRDPGGSPAGIEGFRTTGGSESEGFIATDTAGFSIRNMFMTAPGIGIRLVGQASSDPATDGIISDVEIDQTSLAIDIANAQNLCITNINLFQSRTAFRIGSDTRDMVVSNVLAAYSESVVYFDDGADRIRNLIFGNIALTMNTQLGNFTAFTYSRASNVQAMFHGFSVANHNGYAFRQDAGFKNDLSLIGGVISGERSTTEYTQGTSSKGLSTGFLGTYLVEGISFLNLRGEAFAINGSLGRMTVRGGRRLMAGDALNQFLALPESNATQIKAKYGPLTGMVVNSTDRVVRISVRGMDGFGFAFQNATHNCLVLPYWGYNTEYRVHVRGNLSRSGNYVYGGWENFIVSVRTCFDGGALTQLVEKIGEMRPPTRTAPIDIDCDVCFGVAPGGAASQTGVAVVPTGFICISIAGASEDAGDFEWTAETLN